MLRRQAPRTLVPHYRLFSSRCRRGIEAMLCVTGREEARLDSPSVTAGGAAIKARGYPPIRSEEHTSELQSLMRISYAVFCLKKKNKQKTQTISYTTINNKTIDVMIEIF